MRNLFLTMFFLFCCVFFKEAYGFNHKTGLIIPPGFPHGQEFLQPSFGVTPLPLAYKIDDKFLPPIRDQGQCGSCWAFASTGVLEILLRMKGEASPDLSEQELVSCDKKSYGCSGGFVSNYQKSPGQALEEDFKYAAKNLACKKNLSHPYHMSRWVFIGTAGKKPTVEEIKQANYQYGPLWITVAAGNNAFMNYQSGVLGVDTKCNANAQTDHATVLIGWDEKGNWIVRNSWSTRWGLQGYYKIKPGCFNVASYAAAMIIE